MLKRLLVVIAVVASLAWAQSVRGWGKDGHYIVAWIAYQHLDPTAKVEIDRLLATDATTLWEAAYWPDAVARELPQYRHIAPFHYVNFAEGQDEYDPTRANPNGDVVQGIEKYATIVADKSKSDAERLEALRFLSHFVGDIHQPLHAGRGSDRGGNDLRVTFYNSRTNMHAVWDSEIIKRSHTDWEGFAADLNGMIRPEDVEAYIEHMEPEGWANESYRLAESEIYDEFEPGETLGKNYIEVKLPVVEDQLSIAGVRLATMLNRMFPAAPPAGAAPAPTAEPEPITVYITPGGSKYHAAGCRYLKGRHSPVPLADIAGEKGPCSVCNPPQR